MLDQNNCGIADEAAEAERETAAYLAQRRVDWEAWVEALPTKDQRYFHRNKVKRTYESAMVRAGKAAPPWLTTEDKKQILAIYEAAEAMHMATGIPHEVDHIVQLFGKNKAGEQVISGLHVPWNLRAIPKSLNRKRGDWFFIGDLENCETAGDASLASFIIHDDYDEIPF
ncbi:hypothetical protein [Roseisalinus antarcticus]|uniref:Uncharacterized protein n=1 Tax=Roseisalinus antarcticus TaxID=254357 RepID=A0A1Y5S185_9RHOB|nr:hypothetical protein [Roseisalinus antarcticus]SLN30327.1 hypothetical protein ROA7023_01024 [Roseisalinus antarcticus]